MRLRFEELIAVFLGMLMRATKRLIANVVTNVSKNAVLVIRLVA